MGNPERPLRWGLFGGLFDPVHHGHLLLARDCRRLHCLDRIIFVPSFRPPHRTDGPVASFDDRVAMLRIALAPEEATDVSTIESELDGPGYTLLLVREYKKRYPEVAFSFIMGADNIQQISGWYHPEEIFREAVVLAGVRPGFDLSTAGLATSLPVTLVESGAFDTASTDIRRLLGHDRDNPRLAGLLPSEVLAYIQKHGLYTHAKSTEEDGLSG
jgi:nicotinate-nucleotide adenylyltransferase